MTIEESGMSNLQSDKFNIAWFKLAEFVNRKEKERAFGIYRLLVHSLPEEALAMQLEGDLLLAFNDDRAINSYVKAAELYELNNNKNKALAVYEHCATLLPDNNDLILRLIRMYESLDMQDKVIRSTTQLIRNLVAKRSFGQVLALVIETQNVDMRLLFYIEFIRAYVARYPYNQEHLEIPLQRIADAYQTEQHKDMQVFLHMLSSTCSEAYEYILDYMSHKHANPTKRTTSKKANTNSN